MDMRKLLVGTTVLMLALAVYFFVDGNMALSAAMFAIGMSQIATIAALTAARKQSAAAAKERPE